MADVGQELSKKPRISDSDEHLNMLRQQHSSLAQGTRPDVDESELFTVYYPELEQHRQQKTLRTKQFSKCDYESIRLYSGCYYVSSTKSFCIELNISLFAVTISLQVQC